MSKIENMKKILKSSLLNSINWRNFSTDFAAQMAQTQESRTTKSPLKMQDWVFTLGFTYILGV